MQPSAQAGGSSVLSCTDSEFELGDAGGKRRKPGSPRMKGDVASDKAEAVADSFVSAEDAPKERGYRKKKGKSKEMAKVVREVDCSVGALKAITDELTGILLSSGVDSTVTRGVLRQSSRYEVLLMTLLRRTSDGHAVFVAPKPVGAKAATSVAPAAVSEVLVTPPVVRKPVETWSVVVKGKGVPADQVVEKVVTEVGPTLGVRVHEIKPTRGGGAVIRTPSVAEREKVAANAKFAEVGLEVSVSQKLGPRVVVQRVHSELSVDEFMEELYAMNFRHKMSPQEFKRSVRLVSAPWKTTSGVINVVLEGCEEAMQLLLDVRRCYVKWFSFVVRPQDAVPSCYRCLGFDHMVRNCRFKDEVCRRCGQTGHGMARCSNAIHCRNCAFKGLSAGHYMHSMDCPVYRSCLPILIANCGISKPMDWWLRYKNDLSEDILRRRQINNTCATFDD
ncbi:putative 50 kDa protein in type I retrotransposable element R1DM [Lucilia cuprina]|nr:putative 50 kDa protein in type I retrotransposable element R1DM [Lucilia cuprina]